MRTLGLVTLALAAYVLVSSVLHYIVLPVPYPDVSDLPRRGTTITNPHIHSRFVFRQTTVETDGLLFELDNYVEPGGGPIDYPHVHPHMREIFSVVDGEMRFVVDGEEHMVEQGGEIVVEPGSVHAFENPSSRPSYMIARLEAAADGPWSDRASKGLLPDSQFVQGDRVGGIGGASIVQLIVFGSRYKQVYPPGPAWISDAVSFLVAPTARLFGIRAYYPPASESGRT